MEKKKKKEEGGLVRHPQLINMKPAQIFKKKKKSLSPA
jgi:hypothetical protein